MRISFFIPFLIIQFFITLQVNAKPVQYTYEEWNATQDYNNELAYIIEDYFRVSTNTARSVYPYFERVRSGQVKYEYVHRSIEIVLEDAAKQLDSIDTRMQQAGPLPEKYISEFRETGEASRAHVIATGEYVREELTVYRQLASVVEKADWDTYESLLALMGRKAALIIAGENNVLRAAKAVSDKDTFDYKLSDVLIHGNDVMIHVIEFISGYAIMSQADRDQKIGLMNSAHQRLGVSLDKLDLFIRLFKEDFKAQGYVYAGNVPLQIAIAEGLAANERQISTILRDYVQVMVNINLGTYDIRSEEAALAISTAQQKLEKAVEARQMRLKRLSQFATNVDERSNTYLTYVGGVRGGIPLLHIAESGNHTLFPPLLGDELLEENGAAREN